MRRRPPRLPLSWISTLHHHAFARLAIFAAMTSAAGCAEILGYDGYQIDTSTTGTSGGAGGGGGGHTGGTAGACGNDADCEGSPAGRACDPFSHTCVECLPGGGDACAPGLYCSIEDRCVLGCDDDGDCEANGSGPLTCDTISHLCVGCGVNAPCPPGTKCDPDTGVCKPGCDTQADCPTADFACCNGMCKDLRSDVLNCGACEDPCVPADSTVWACIDGGCVFQSCLAGWADCDQNQSKGDGCETNVLADPTHCGDCGTSCQISHALGGCVAGTCAIASCDASWGNCDDQQGNGCESDLNSDALHCGACDTPCSFANASSTCLGGSCKIGPCDPGFESCDLSADNGCETSLSTETDCGACGAPCPSINGAGSCVNGQCTIACAIGFGDCDGLAANGCETSLGSTVAHCGACGHVCPSNGGAPFCLGGQCGESNCQAGTGNCDGNPGNGCETSLATPSDCGSCGNTCSSSHGTPSCNGSTCNITCEVGFGNCNNLAADGCEQPLKSLAHCGACGVPCARPHASASCATGSCQIVGCAPGWADCNAIGSDGCEVDLSTSLENCGGCGNACATICNGGVCQ